MPRNRNNQGFPWWLFFIFVFFVGDSSALLWLLAASVVGLTIAAVKSSNNRDERRRFTRDASYRRTKQYVRSGNNSDISPADAAKAAVYLRKWFNAHEYLYLENGISLRLANSTATNADEIQVYKDGSLLSTLDAFQSRYPQEFNNIIQQLLRLEKTSPVEDTPADTTVKTETKQDNTPEKNAQYYIDMINSLNDEITDDDITNGLYTTSSLLTQIQSLEQKFPESKSKLKKLYDYYLPILVNILTQFSSLQGVTSDPSYASTKEKLTKTIGLINDAMSTIISSMTDDNFINLSADMSTLEAVLQKDGLTSEGNMKKMENKEESHG